MPTSRPDRASLQEAALTHLSRYAVTQRGLLRVLERRIARWERETAAAAEEVGAARDEAARVVRALAEAGAVDDAGFAEARAGRLLRSGRSRRAVSAHLAAKGVEAELAARVAGEGDELAAALAFARRRRLGPFRTEAADEEARRRELAAFARAGFGRAVAEAALAATPEAAETALRALRGS